MLTPSNVYESILRRLKAGVFGKLAKVKLWRVLSGERLHFLDVYLAYSNRWLHEIDFLSLNGFLNLDSSNLLFLGLLIRDVLSESKAFINIIVLERI